MIDGDFKMHHEYSVLYTVIFVETILIGQVFSDCPPERYGVDCEGWCHCKDGPSACNQTGGGCITGECSPGYLNPPACRDGCAFGYFGKDCDRRCRCPPYEGCNNVNGVCNLGRCLDGWSGPSCQLQLPILDDTPTLELMTLRSATLSWRPWNTGLDGGEGPVGEYGLQYRVNDTIGWTNGFAVTANNPDIKKYKGTIINLQPNTYYNIRLFVRRAVRNTLYVPVPSPEYIMGFTTCEKPYSPPDCLNAGIRSRNKTAIDIAVTWRTPPVFTSNCDEHVAIILDVKNCNDEDKCTNLEYQSPVSRGVVDVTGLPWDNTVEITAFILNNANQKSPPSPVFYITNISAVDGPSPPPNPGGGPPVPPDIEKQMLALKVAVIVLVALIVFLFIPLVIFLLLKLYKKKGDPGSDNMPGYNDKNTLLEKILVCFKGLNKLKVKQAKSEEKATMVVQAWEPPFMAEQRTTLSGQQGREMSLFQLRDDFRNRQRMVELLRTEYNTLPIGFLRSTMTANEGANAEFNRTAQVYPYDDNRVVLKENYSPKTDYINASFVKVSPTFTYIVTQAPLTSTVDQFWQMVWENQVHRIIMLMDLQEPMTQPWKKYWKEKPTDYGDIRVTVLNTSQFAHFAIRKIELCSVATKETRLINHFQYITWSKSGVPTNLVPFILFVKKVEQNVIAGEYTVVQCPNGGGRSGMFVASEIQSDVSKPKDMVDVFSCAQQLRKERVRMMSTFSQYRFVHEFLAEMDCTKYAKTIDDYRQRVTPSNGARTDTIATEFLDLMRRPVLSFTSTRSPPLFPVGENPKPESELGSLDNNIVSSYKQRDLFLVLKSPKQPYQTSEILELAWDKQIKCIVTFGQDTLAVQIWLDSQKRATKTYGKFTVVAREARLGGQDDKESRETRYDSVTDFEISRSDKPPSVTLLTREFRHISWNSSVELPTPSEFVQFYFDVLLYLESHPTKAPLIIHCQDGSKQSGIFIAVWSILEQIKAEKVVDVFSMVAYIRSQLPDTINTLNQYEFCHNVILQYLHLASKNTGHRFSTVHSFAESTSSEELDKPYRAKKKKVPTATLR